MDVLEQLTAQFPSIDQPNVIILILCFAAVLLTVYGISSFASGENPVLRRLQDIGKETTRARNTALGPLNNSQFAANLEKLLVPKDKNKRGRTRIELARAGYRGVSAVRTYYLARVALGVAVLVLTAVTFPLLSSRLSSVELLVVMLLLIAIAYYLPVAWVARRKERRQQAIREGFPDALDTLLVCVEAGLGLDAAIARAKSELFSAHPIIAEELSLASDEFRAGKGRAEVLRDMAVRSDVDEVNAFAGLLIQADKFGTSLGSALRVYAREMRTKRLLRAEEKANQLPFKLSLLAGFCAVPAMIIFVLSPGFVALSDSLTELFQRF